MGPPRLSPAATWRSLTPCTLQDFLAAFFQLPTNNRVEYEVACYSASSPGVGAARSGRSPFLRSSVRWVVMSQRGGVMTDYDVMNVGWPAPQPLPARLSTLEAHGASTPPAPPPARPDSLPPVPAVVIGSASEFLRAAQYFANFSLPPVEELDTRTRNRFTSKRGRVHMSDMVLISYAIDQGLFDKRHLAFAKGEKGGREAPLVHFSHSAVHRYGEGKSRNELMRTALKQVGEGRFVNEEHVAVLAGGGKGKGGSAVLDWKAAVSGGGGGGGGGGGKKKQGKKAAAEPTDSEAAAKKAAAYTEKVARDAQGEEITSTAS